MKEHVVILGAGFGGLELATRLHELVPDLVDVTLIDKSDHFIVGLAKFDVLFGRKTAGQIKSYYRDLAVGAIDFRQECVTSIDPASRHVVTDKNTYEADVLVVALGADIDSQATPGLVDGGYEFYTLPGTERLAQALPSFTAGNLILAILGSPYKCPPAPFEAALQLHDSFVARGVRDDITMRVLSPAPTPLPVSKEGSETVGRLMAERDIEFLPGHLVTALDPASKTVAVRDRDPMAYDLFVGVPKHRVPPVVAASGLAQGDWVPVDPGNLATRFPNVYAIGDATTVPVGEGAVPKAGAFAERAAMAVADDIAYRLTGSGAPGRYDAAGACFLEFGDGEIAKIEANLLGGPEPRIGFHGPSKAYRADKDAFAPVRLARWFRT